jgi:hypothetical protein
MDTTDPKIKLMLEMCERQGEYSEMYRQQQIQKRKEYNLIQKSKKYYGNSKEYRNSWAKHGAIINK